MNLMIGILADLINFRQLIEMTLEEDRRVELERLDTPEERHR
jgi:hypothetical protein